MPQMVIKGCRPYDGEYELDFGQELTTREWGWMKRLAGYLPLTVDDDAYGDPEFLCALAAIVMRRAGKIEAKDVPAAYERFADLPFGEAITVKGDAEEVVEEDRPTPQKSSSTSDISGRDSMSNSAKSESRPRPIGDRLSATSASDRATSAT